jgi:creatinine amidohydrolase
MVEAMNFIEYEQARPEAVREMLRRSPAAYVPLGALEWHGEHLPLGLDGLKAHALCAAAAEISGGVVFPPMQWGAFDTMPFPFTFSFPPGLTRVMVRRVLSQLADFGFQAIVLLGGHYPPAQVKLLRRECRRLSRSGRAFALGVPETALAHELGYYGDHAGRWETSIMMALRPELVDLSVLPPMTTLERQARAGIMGQDPRTRADAEDGRKAIARIAAGLAAAVAAVLAERSDRAFEEVYARSARSLRPSWRNRLGWGLVEEALDVHSLAELWRYWLWTVRNL